MTARDKASANRVLLRFLVPLAAAFAFAGGFFNLRPLLVLYVVRIDPEVLLSEWIGERLVFF